MVIDGKIIKSIFKETKNLESYYSKRKKYYYDDQDIKRRLNIRLDGNVPNEVVTNWIEHIIFQHTGFMLSNPVKYDSPNEADLRAIEEMYKVLDLQTVDLENLTYSLLYGTAIEVVAYGDSFTSDNYNPIDWRIIKDDQGIIKFAINHAIIPAFTVFEDTIETKDREFFIVYTETSIDYFQYMNRELSLYKTVPHYFGEVPIIEYSISEDFRSIITDSIIDLQDSWNKTFSNLLDDSDYSIDGMLKIKGYDVKAMFEKNEYGVTLARQLQVNKMIAVDADGDVDYLNKPTFPVEKYNTAFDRTKYALHKVSKIVDTDSITGATGETSGIALKMRFQPLYFASNNFQKYFKMGLQKRIKFFNRILELTNKPMIDIIELDINFQPALLMDSTIDLREETEQKPVDEQPMEVHTNAEEIIEE
jgi:SPP1 family phage portal protein